MRVGKLVIGRASAARTSTVRASSTKNSLFDKILIANRGEISCRVTRTAHRLGIKTVAIYSDPDVNSMHVRQADEAYCVGPAQSALSYLNIPRVIEAIEESGSQAVHPGYGFLSENSHFVEELEKRNITFIGPKATAMEALGDKINSKHLAIKAGVNTIPGYLGDIADAEEAVRIARDIGYPVMVKASSGGGGKGMRVAYNDDEVRVGYRLSKSEAKASFASDVVFIEKFIEEPRHIEVQLIADNYGNVVALPERECTIQRRNQKVIEESPSTLLDEKTRRAMQDQAASLARSVGYNSAGTVEFLCDKHKNFYFLEMNTRLQVEHPVSEMVSGLDLVELMIRSAAGERLPSSLVDAPLPILGHAFESRVYAEDPFRHFLPSTGRLSYYAEPSAVAHRDPYVADNIRADAGVTQGSEISMFYDPMICKLITHGETRDDALDRMRAALDSYVIRGVGHNISFMRALVDHPRYISGKIDTGFIKAEYPEGFKGVKLTQAQHDNMIASAAIMNAIRQYAARDISGKVSAVAAPEIAHVIVSVGRRTVSTVDGKESVTEPHVFDVKLEMASAEDALSASDNVENMAKSMDTVPMGDGHVWIVHMTPVNPHTLQPLGESATVRVGNVDWSADSPLLLGALIDAAADARRSDLTLRVQQVARLLNGFRLQLYGAQHDVYVHTPHAYSLLKHTLPARTRDMGRVIASPMPGALISVAVKDGQEVEEGQEVAVVEAMKMQNVLRAPKAAKVKKVCAKAGDTLAVDQIIIEFD